MHRTCVILRHLLRSGDFKCCVTADALHNIFILYLCSLPMVLGVSNDCVSGYLKYISYINPLKY